MEFLYFIRRILQELGRFPRIAGLAVAFPSHQILKLPPIHMAVPDFIYLVFLLAFYFNRLGGRG